MKIPENSIYNNFQFKKNFLNKLMKLARGFFPKNSIFYLFKIRFAYGQRWALYLVFLHHFELDRKIENVKLMRNHWYGFVTS